MAEKSLLKAIADPMVRKNVGCDDRNMEPGMGFSPEVRKLMFTNNFVANWVHNRTPISTLNILEISKGLPIEVEAVDRVAPKLHETDKGERRYRNFLRQICTDTYIDAFFHNGVDFKNIVKNCYPWILDRIAGNEDLIDNLNSDKEVEQTVIKTALLYVSYEYGLYIDQLRTKRNNKN